MINRVQGHSLLIYHLLSDELAVATIHSLINIFQAVLAI